MRRLRAATLVTPDPEATAALYAEWLDYEVVERGRVPDDLAAAWDAPDAAGRTFVVCRPASGAPVFLRLVEGAVVEGFKPLRTYGWAAVELCVGDVLQVHERLRRSPFEVIGPPARIEGLPTIFPMQVKGPDGEVIYLTQLDDDPPGFELPRAACLIDQLFILVLACSDMHASGAWLERVCGLTQDQPMDLVYTLLSQAFGLPEAQLHTIATLADGRDLFLQVDQYPPGAVERPRRPGALPPGIALATLTAPDLEAAPGPWLSPPALREGVVYGGRRAAVARGPDGVLVELVEA